MRKKWIAGFMIAVLFTGILTGCGKPTQGSATDGGNQELPKGGYVEKEMTLPKGRENAPIVMLDRENGELKVYFMSEENESGMAQIVAYNYGQADGWREETPEWLQQVELPYDSWESVRILHGTGGKEYLYAVYEDPKSENNSVGHLYLSEDGGSVTEVTPEDWLVPDEEMNYYRIPTDLALLNDGTLVVKYYYETVLYDVTTGEKKQEFNNYNAMEQVYAMGNQYVQLLSNDIGEFAGIGVYVPGKETPEYICAAEQENMGDSGLDILEDQSMVLANGDGIFRVQAGAEEVGAQVISGDETALSDMHMWCIQLKAVEDVYYILFGLENGNRVLMQYAFDEEKENLQPTELTLYTLYENFTLQQAAVQYHKEHPEVTIHVETALSYEAMYSGDVDIEDVKNKFRADLMAENGADILVMDDLNPESLIEKGVFADLSDIVNPMEADGELLSNITSAYRQEDGNLSIVPLSFAMDLIVSTGVDAASVSDLKSLAAAMENQSEKMLGSVTASDLVETFAPHFISEIIQDKELNKEALAENLAYLKAIADHCGVVQEYGDHVPGLNVLNVMSGQGAGIYTDKGFMDAMIPINVAKDMKGSYDSFGDTFMPMLLIGVNARGEHVDIAKDFVAFTLSQAVQDFDNSEGFPVNAKSLEKQAYFDRSDYSVAIGVQGLNGETEVFNMEAYEIEEAEKLADLCLGLTRVGKRDVAVEQEIKAALPDYLSGKKSLEDTVREIEGVLGMYLAE